MGSTATAYGLVPVRKIGSGANSNGISTYPTANNNGSAFYEGDIVSMSAGRIVAYTSAGMVPFGVFKGVRYNDTTGRPQWDNTKTSTQTNTGTNVDGFTVPTCEIYDDPNETFKIVADGTIADTSIGKYAAVNVSAGSAYTGRSGFTLKTSTISTDPTGRCLQILGLYKEPGNAFSDSYTVVEVQLKHTLLAKTCV